MRFLLFLVLALFFCLFSFSQDVNCVCTDVLQQVIKKIDSNYLGLRHASIQGNIRAYEKRKKEYSGKAASITSSECSRFLQDFLSYFRDGHLFVWEAPQMSKEERQRIREQLQNSKVDTKELQERLHHSSDPASLVGKWTDGTSTFGIVRTSDTYSAYIIETKDTLAQPGCLKAVFTPRQMGFDVKYFSADQTPRYLNAFLGKEGTLLAAGSVYWARIESPYSREIDMVDRNEIISPKISSLDSNTILFSIPSFQYDWGLFQKMIQDHTHLLTNSKTIIFDIRGNTGGNAIYLNFIEIIADKNLFPASQGHVLASLDTKTYYEKMITYDTLLYGRVVANIEKNLGSVVDGPAYPAEKLNLIPNKIQHVAILTDKVCASAAESFILQARSVSSKVKVFGSPTFGMIDYTSVNSVPLRSGKQHIYFAYPTSSLHKDIPDHGYNKTGILPDIPIPATVKDKIGYIVDYYKR